MDVVEHKILNKLIFAESLNALFEEIDEENNIIADTLKILIRKGCVATVKDQSSQIGETQIYYDTDHMHSYAYIITAKGLKDLNL